jgi:hypothetical protein
MTRLVPLTSTTDHLTEPHVHSGANGPFEVKKVKGKCRGAAVRRLTGDFRIAE